MKVAKSRQKQWSKSEYQLLLVRTIWSFSHTEMEKLSKHLTISFESTEELHYRSEDYVSRPGDSP